MATIRTQREIRQRAPIWLITLLVANFIVMAIDARDQETRQRKIRVWAQTAASPFQNVSSRAGGATSGLFHQIVNFRSAAKENERLNEQLTVMQSELRNAREHSAENQHLRALLNLKEQTGYDNVPARVIGRDPSVWFNTVTIDRGSSSGVRVNMPVVTANGIVGRVITVNPWSSQVMLITDEKAGAGGVVGQLGQSGALGSIRGGGEKGLVEMRYVSGLEQVEVGDYVLTTGQDGIYPAGLNVGEVVELRRGSATQPHQILIRPSARLDQLQDVAVLLYQAPQRPAPEQSLPNIDKTKK
ncbi:MAG TPA: rod shape-determining protein MreC [Pyrinomonadaceae bacterium]|nr:rod shape-determining protein MreC [Pyrinomonadaceae bacterium]HLE61564.1 rod shape-determining protein MreC [Pyrinomonadaceae bacterium]